MHHMDKDHVSRAPKAPKRGLRQKFTQEERKRNGFCRFWNHSECSFGEFCRFVHEEAPHCRFQDQCRAKPMCQYFHEEYLSAGGSSSSPPSSTFLEKRSFQGRMQGRYQNQRSH